MGLSVAESGAFIASHAEHIKISEDGLKSCAEDIAQQILSGELDMKTMFVKTAIHPQSADESGLDWVLFADTLNFSFWQPENDSTVPQYLVTYKDETYTGYLAMCAAINRTLDSGIDLTSPAFYRGIEASELNKYLMGDNEVPIPLVEERVRCLREVGHKMMQRFGGHCSNLLQECNNSAVKLLELVLEHFECFRDSAVFRDTQVAIHKRAQIFVADVWCLFEGTGNASFTDIDKLTMFADYRVPQSLQHYRIFLYDEQLMSILRDDKLLENGHPYEVEIRGCSIQAVELLTHKIKTILRTKGSDATCNSILVDQYLWGYRRKNAEDMKNFPYHKVRSIYY